MDALHEAIKKIHDQPEHPTSGILCDLIRALDSGVHFDLSKLYHLNYSDFSLVMNILKQWRLDSFRYERGALMRAAGDASLKLEVNGMRYGRWGIPSRA